VKRRVSKDVMNRDPWKLKKGHRKIAEYGLGAAH